MSKADFVFTVGYHGSKAIVDASLKRKYSRLNTLELARQGFYKQALCSALYDQSEEDLKNVLEVYNGENEIKIESVEALKRTFGVQEIPENIDSYLFI